MAFAATWMDLEIIMLSEVRHWNTNILASTYMWNLKNDTMNLFAEQKLTHSLWKTLFPKETGCGVVAWVLGWKCCKVRLWWWLYIELKKAVVCIHIHGMEYYSTIKKMRKPCHMQYGWIWGHYAKWNQSYREGQI